MKALDYVLIVGILIAAAGLFAFNILSFGSQVGDDDLVIVRVDGLLYGQYPLDQDIVITIGSTEEDGYNQIEIKDKLVSMIDADCRDQVCVHTRPIEKAYQTIVCLPNRVTVELAANTPSVEEGEVDDISR